MPWEGDGENESPADNFLESWGYPRGTFMPEHLAIYGQTGSGKSYFEKTILMERARLRGSRIVVVATKAADKTLTDTGWPIVDTWPPATGWTKDKRRYNQVIYWARAHGLNRESQEYQRRKVEELLDKLWKPESNTIVAFDELAYICDDLGLKTEVTTYYREARANGITIVASTQRPNYVPRYMHSESTWSVFFAPKDQEDAERMAQVAGDKTYYMRVFRELDRRNYEFLLVHTLTGECVISSLPKTPYHVAGPGIKREAPKTPKPVTE